MKKFYMIILAALSIAVSTVDVSDWEEHYDVLNNCGASIEIFHAGGYVGMVDQGSTSMAKRIIMKGTVNGCKYDVFLEYDVSQEVFEEQMIASGFEIVGTRPVTIQPIMF